MKKSDWSFHFSKQEIITHELKFMYAFIWQQAPFMRYEIAGATVMAIKNIESLGLDEITEDYPMAECVKDMGAEFVWTQIKVYTG